MDIKINLGRFYKSSQVQIRIPAITFVKYHWAVRGWGSGGGVISGHNCTSARIWFNWIMCSPRLTPASPCRAQIVALERKNRRLKRSRAKNGLSASTNVFRRDIALFVFNCINFANSFFRGRKRGGQSDFCSTESRLRINEWWELRSR